MKTRNRGLLAIAAALTLLSIPHLAHAQGWKHHEWAKQHNRMEKSMAWRATHPYVGSAGYMTGVSPYTAYRTGYPYVANSYPVTNYYGVNPYMTGVNPYMTALNPYAVNGVYSGKALKQEIAIESKLAKEGYYGQGGLMGYSPTSMLGYSPTSMAMAPIARPLSSQYAMGSTPISGLSSYMNYGRTPYTGTTNPLAYGRTSYATGAYSPYTNGNTFSQKAATVAEVARMLGH